MDHHVLFDSTEELTLLKHDIIKNLRDFIHHHTYYFLPAMRSPKYNPRRIPIVEFTIEALLYIIQSMSLTKGDELETILTSILKENYKMTDEIAHEVIQNMFAHRCSTEIILLAENKMRKHVEGMLRTHSYQEVMDIYRRYLFPRPYEKKNLGQVFTPFPLIEKIIDHIPHDIMLDPKSTFFDPSAGMGGFLVILYKRLMITLTSAIPNKKKRHEHIVSKMLFAAELTKNNVHRMKKIFGSTFHVYEGNSLKLDNETMKKHFGVEQMTVIVGNPPFENEQKKETKKVAGYSLWIEFVNMSLDHWLQKDGIFGMLLPPGWRKASDDKSRTKDLWKRMSSQCTPLYIEMLDENETKTYFNAAVSIRADLIVLQKKKNTEHKTLIIGTDKKTYNMDLTKLPFLPNGHIGYWKRYITNNKKEGMKVLYSRSIYGSDKKTVRTNADQHYKYKVIHSIHVNGSCVYLYTDKKNKDGGFGVSKVIFNEFGNWNKPILDWNGQFGMSQHVFALLISSKQEGEQIIRYFNQNKLNFFANDLNWSTSRPTVSWKLFRNIKNGFWVN